MDGYTISGSDNRVRVTHSVTKKSRALVGVTNLQVCKTHVRALGDRDDAFVTDFKYSGFPSNRTEHVRRRVSKQLKPRWQRKRRGNGTYHYNFGMGNRGSVHLVCKGGFGIHPTAFGTAVDMYIKTGQTKHVQQYLDHRVMDVTSMVWLRNVIANHLFPHHTMDYDVYTVNARFKNKPTVGSIMDAVATHNRTGRSHIVEFKTILTRSNHFTDTLYPTVFRKARHVSVKTLLEALAKPKFKRDTILRGILQVMCYRLMAPNTCDNVDDRCYLVLYYPLEDVVYQLEFTVGEAVLGSLTSVWPHLNPSAGVSMKRGTGKGVLRHRVVQPEQRLRHSFHFSKVCLPETLVGFAKPQTPCQIQLVRALDSAAAWLGRGCSNDGVNREWSCVEGGVFSGNEPLFKWFAQNVIGATHYRTEIIRNKMSMDTMFKRAAGYLHTPERCEKALNKKTKTKLIQLLFRTYDREEVSREQVCVFFHPFRNCFTRVRVVPKKVHA